MTDGQRTTLNTNLLCNIKIVNSSKPPFSGFFYRDTVDLGELTNRIGLLPMPGHGATLRIKGRVFP